MHITTICNKTFALLSVKSVCQPESTGENRNYSRYFKPRGNWLIAGDAERGDIGRSNTKSFLRSRAPMACASVTEPVQVRCRICH